MATHDADKAFFDYVRRSRLGVIEQIRQSQITIEQSMELLRRTDEMIAKTEKPW